MSLSQGYAYVYREESDIITTYLLNDLPSYFPTGDIIKAIPGLKLKHIIPGVRNGTSFLACISTNSVSCSCTGFFFFYVLGEKAITLLIVCF